MLGQTGELKNSNNKDVSSKEKAMSFYIKLKKNQKNKTRHHNLDLKSILCSVKLGDINL